MNFQQRQQQEQEQQQKQKQQQEHQEQIISGLILQDVCTSLTKNFQMQSINSFQHLSSQYIDQVVEIEMKRSKANCSREEANYVEQMLLENPIIVERRTTSEFPTKVKKTSASSSSPITEANDVFPPDYYCYSNVHNVGYDDKVARSHRTKQQQQETQQQRSDSCRRSRINNKIKRAKTKYRHKFMSNKLLQSANVLKYLQKLIEQTENQLINQGFNALQLLKLKRIFYSDYMAME